MNRAIGKPLSVARGAARLASCGEVRTRLSCYASKAYIRRELSVMRLDANIRFFLVAMGGTIAPAMMFAIFAWLTGHVPLWWSIVVGVASGLVAVWGGMTFFGIFF